MVINNALSISIDENRPIRLFSTQGMSRSEWLEKRRLGIGGSDAAAICGLNRYSSPFDVYIDKMGLACDETETEPMRFGRDMEDYVARRFCEETGKKVKRQNAMFRHPKHEWMLANVDRVVIGEDALLECKTAGDGVRWKFAEGEYDPAHYVQCQHYLAVMGKKMAYLAVYQRMSGLHIFPIERNDDEIESLVRLEEAFWRDHVLTGCPPPPDGSKATNEALKKMFPRVEKETTLLANKEDLLNERAAIDENMKALEARKNLIEQEIKLEMGDAEIGRCDGWRVSWSNIAGRTTINAKALKKEHPDIYLKYAKTGESYRRFNVSKVEEDIAL